MGKLSALLDVFRTGKEVSNVEAWKRGTINVNLVTAVLAALLALAKAFGLSLDLTYEQLGFVATALVAVVALANSLLTAATSTRAGLPGLAGGPAVDAARMVKTAAAVSAAQSGGQGPGSISGGDQKGVSDGGQHGDPARPVDDRVDPFRDHGA